VASFAVSFFLQNAVMMAYGGNTVGVNFAPALTRSLEFAGLRIPYLQIVTLGTTVALVAGLAIFLKRTRFGAQMRAAAEDFRMARLMGVRANLVIGVAFATSGLLASVVSLLYVTQVGMLTPQMGIQPALIGFVATVVGGLGSLLGATIGGFFIGALTVTLQILLPLELRPFRDAFVFSILFMVLLVRPGGLIVVPWAKERI
jgi:branched-chain amino acid transport system permease protein